MILTSHFRWNVKVSDSIFVRHWNSIRNGSSVPYIVLHGTVDAACFLRNFRRQFFQNAYSAKVLQTTGNTSHALTTPLLGEPSHVQTLAYRTTETLQVRLHKCRVLKSKAAHQHSSTTSKCVVTLASSAVFSKKHRVGTTACMKVSEKSKPIVPTGIPSLDLPVRVILY